MKLLFLIGAICMVAGPASAVDWHPITGSDSPMHYDMATGEIKEQTQAQTRSMSVTLWSMTDRTGFGSAPDSWLWLDCADIEADVWFQNLGYAFYTNCQASAGGIDLWIPLYGSENNYEDDPRIIQAVFVLEDLPGSEHPPDEYWGRGWTVSLTNLIPLDGADLDGDGLHDFGYGYSWRNHPPGIVGAPSVGEPNVEYPLAPGAEDGWSFWDISNDPNFVDDPNLHDPNISEYIGYYDFRDPNLLGQFYFELIFVPHCPNYGGTSGHYCTADISNCDCVVSLSDLAQLLSHYGMTTGARRYHGDIDPYRLQGPGDGDVDIGDLAEMLAQYGDNCIAPF